MEKRFIKDPIGFLTYYREAPTPNELVIAIDIFLAEISLTPDYYIFARLNMSRVEMKETVINQLEQYRNAGYEKNFDEKGILKVTYYFHYLQWIRNLYSLKEEICWIAYSKVVAHEIIESRYKQQVLRSRVAKALFERSLMLNDMFVKSDCFIASLKNNTANETILYNKMLGAVTLQHRELYELEVERLKSHSEYSLYEKFEDVLDSTYQLLFDTQSILL